MRFQKDFVNRVVAAYRQGTLANKVSVRLGRSLRTLTSAAYLIKDPARGLVSLHCPEYVLPDARDRDLVARIFRSYRLMKACQPAQRSCYAPAPMWQAFLTRAYSPLTEGLRDNDLDRVHYFLANFGAWRQYTAVESSTLLHEGARSFLGRKYLENAVFYKQLEFWRWFHNNRKTLSSLTYPLFGNQSGAYIDGIFVGVGSFFNEIYGSLLANLIRGTERPVIAELGAGYGKLAFFTLRALDRFVYIDFDLPETLCLAAYYLMKAYPDKPALLYGEAEYSPEAHGKYELIFMPSWEIDNVGSATVDLFINKNSLGEMEKAAVHNYVARMTCATRYFFHMNHDVTPADVNGSASGLLGSDYPVPGDRFRLLFRYPDLGHFLFHEGGANFRMDIFLYLYERIDPLVRHSGKA